MALILMPWVSVSLSSAALGLLKSYLLQRRIRADCHYFNIRLAKRVGFRIYDYIANYGGVAVGLTLGEWFFSRILFGPSGTRELDNDFEVMMARPAFKSVVEELTSYCNLSLEDLRRIADVEIPAFLRDCLDRVDWSRYDLVGFSDPFWSNLACLALAKGIKGRFPDKKVVFGGPNAHDEMGLEILRSFPWVDYVVDGEGEQALVGLVEGLVRGHPLEGIPGVSFRRGGEVVANLRDDTGHIPLDSLPRPHYGDYLREFRNAGFQEEVEPRLMFEGSRGCWFGAKSRCTFCGFGKTMTYQSKSPERLLQEILFMHRRHKVIHFHCTDDILDMKYFDTFLPMLGERVRREGLHLILFYEVKSNLKKKHVALLAGAGVKDLNPGIESLNAEILKAMRKGVSPIQNIQTLKFVRQFDIDTGWNILYGFPGERPSQYEQTLDILPLLTHLQPPKSVHRIRVDRFSPYHASGETLGLTNVRPLPAYGHLYPARVRLPSMAYFFDYDYKTEQPDPETYLRPIKDFVDRWRRAFKFTFCFYLKGADFMDIHDYRFLSPGDPQPAYRRFRLLKPHTDIYLFCESYQSLEAVGAFLAERFPSKYTPEEVQRALEDLVSKKLMFQENNQYLSLALPMDSKDIWTLERVKSLRVLSRIGAAAA